MDRVETPIFRHPMESLGHAMHATPAWLGRHWKLSLPLAIAAGLGSVYAFSQLIRPYTPDTKPRENTPVSDTKPPEPNLGVAVVDNPPAQPASVVAKEPIVEHPVISPLEQAIKTGRIEVGNLPANSIKPLSPDEARNFLAEANASVRKNEDIRIILSLDPRLVPKLVLETLKYRVPKGEANALGLKNIGSKTVFPSFVDGEATFLPGVAVGGTKAIGVEIKSGGNTYGVLARREGLETPLPHRQPVPVKIGDPLFSIGTEEPLGFYQGDQQIVINFTHDDSNVWKGSLYSLLLDGENLTYLSSNKR